MPVIYIALGSNQGNRQDNIDKAIGYLKKRGIKIHKISTIIETDPVGGPPQGKFLNGVLEGDTFLPPKDLIVQLKTIERQLGRVQTEKDGPRPIDLDLLMYGDLTLETPELTIPHPRMHERDFVMTPLSEINPQLAKKIINDRR